MGIAIDELAIRAGTSTESIRRIADLGLLGPEAGRTSFDESIVPRIRLALQLEQSGISLDDVAQAVAAGRFSLEFTDALFGRPVAMSRRSSTELKERSALSDAFFEDVRVALGSVGDDADLVREDNAELLELLERFVGQGLDESVAEQVAVRFFYVLVDAARRVAAGGRELWDRGVAEPLRARGLGTQEFLDAMAAPGPESQLLVGPMLTLLFHRFIEREIIQEVMLHIEAGLEEAGIHRVKDERPPSIAFLDLTGYTSMTETSGDEAAADYARLLVDLVRRGAVEHRGRLVKMLGDGAMMHFEDPAAAVQCGLHLVDRAPGVGLPSARVGVSAGPLIQRDGDYFGRTVNIAARVTDYARANEVLVTADVAAALPTTADLSSIGPVALKGVGEPIELFSVRRS